MLTAYGPDHRRLRGLVAGAFTARRVAVLRPRIEAITGGLLDGLADLPPDRPVDLRERYIQRLPIKVICAWPPTPASCRRWSPSSRTGTASCPSGSPPEPDARLVRSGALARGGGEGAEECQGRTAR